MTETEPTMREGGAAWRFVASYALGSWVVLQVGETLSSLIGLPLWFGRVLLVVLVIGLVAIVAASLLQARLAPDSRGGRAGPLTWKRLVLVWATGVALLAAVAATSLSLRVMGVAPFGTLQAQGVFREHEALILADFGGDAGLSDLSRVATALMRVDLAQSGSFEVLEPIQIAPVLSRMRWDRAEPVTFEVALEAARREGIKAIIDGELLAAGNAIVVSVRLVESASGRVLAASRETSRDASDIPDAVDRLSAHLRERIGGSLRDIQQEAPLAEVTTASMRALDRYARAIRANDLGDLRRATSLLEQAIAEDSTFAMAHRKLGILLNNQDPADTVRAKDAFRRAYDLRDHLTDRERGLTEAAYLLYVEHQAELSLDRYLTLLENYPTDRVALNNVAVAYWGSGNTSGAAEVLLRSIELGGAPATTFSMAANIFSEMGDTAAVRRVIDRFADSYPDNPSVDGLRAELLAPPP